MRQIVALGIVAGVVAGLAGGLTVIQLSDSAGAAPSLQAREDQITVFSEANMSYTASIVPSPLGYGPLSGAAVILVGLDPGDYPPTSGFRLEGVWAVSPGSASCLRLFDRTANSAIAGA